MDLDLLLEKADFHSPFFADFIIRKYADLNISDPGRAQKIADRIFTPEFITHMFSQDLSIACSK